MLFQQLVNRMCSHCLFPACWQVVNGLLTTCYKVNGCWAQQTCYKLFQQLVIVLQFNKLWVTTLYISIVATCWQVCYKSVEPNNIVASCQQTGNKQCEHILLTSCWNSIATSLLQLCYNFCIFTCVGISTILLLLLLRSYNDYIKISLIIYDKFF
jgi:hypothetical protein